MYKRKKKKNTENYKPIQTNISHKYKYKICQQISSKQSIKQCIKIVIYHDQVEFIPDMHSWFNILKSVNVIHHINSLEKKKIHIN